MDIDQLDTTNNMKLIIYVFQNITEFKYLEKLEGLIRQLVKFLFFKDFKNKKNDLQGETNAILFSYIMESIPIKIRYTIFNIFMKKLEEELGGNMAESILEPLKEMVAIREREKVMQKGREEGMQETALKMKQEGCSIELIKKVTDLSVKEIERL